MQRIKKCKHISIKKIKGEDEIKPASKEKHALQALRFLFEPGQWELWEERGLDSHCDWGTGGRTLVSS
jgi:hypothetical protein